MPEHPEQPATPVRPRLSRRQLRTALLTGLAPVLLAAIALSPFVFTGAASLGELAAASLVYGGLLGLAAGFVYADRAHARQCPRCGANHRRRIDVCPDCGYDLEQRPRFACEERHAVYLEPGLCACGRRLQRLPQARGIGGEVKAMLRFGGWFLLFLLAVGTLLRVTSGG